MKTNIALELRDFLFYVIPGAVLLLALFLLSVDSIDNLAIVFAHWSALGNLTFGDSLFLFLGMYLLGVIGYSVTYAILQVANAVASVSACLFGWSTSHTVPKSTREYFAAKLAILRRQVLKLLGKEPRVRSSDIDEDSADFIKRMLSASKEHPDFYAGEILRYRSLARFHVALLLPFEAVVGVALHKASVSEVRIVIWTIGLVLIAGSVVRALRCNNRYIAITTHYNLESTEP